MLHTLVQLKSYWLRDLYEMLLERSPELTIESNLIQFGVGKYFAKEEIDFWCDSQLSSCMELLSIEEIVDTIPIISINNKAFNVLIGKIYSSPSLTTESAVSLSIKFAEHVEDYINATPGLCSLAWNDFFLFRFARIGAAILRDVVISRDEIMAKKIAFQSILKNFARIDVGCDLIYHASTRYVWTIVRGYGESRGMILDNPQWRAAEKAKICLYWYILEGYRNDSGEGRSNLSYISDCSNADIASIVTSSDLLAKCVSWLGNQPSPSPSDIDVMITKKLFSVVVDKHNYHQFYNELGSNVSEKEDLIAFWTRIVGPDELTRGTEEELLAEEKERKKKKKLEDEQREEMRLQREEYKRWRRWLDTPGYEMAPCVGGSGFSGRSAMGGRKVRTGRF